MSINADKSVTDKSLLGGENPVPPASPNAPVSRSAFNLVLVAAVFLFIGLITGYLAYERVDRHTEGNAGDLSAVDTQALIQQAVGTAIAAVPQAAAGAIPDPNMRYEVDVAGNPSRGPDDAAITVIEFGDFRCGYCKRFNDETIEPLMERFEGNIRLVFRDYPVLGRESQLAALAAECADDQGKFWEFHNLLYASPDQMNRDAFLSYATMLEMDISAFSTCYDGEAHRDEIIQDYVTGQNLGVTGTPTFFINGRIIVGAQPLESFALMIEAELAEIENASASES